MNFKTILFGVVVALVIGIFITVPALAQEKTTESSGASLKQIGAGIAFGLAGLGAGIGLGYIGSAGIAALSENPALQSRILIFLGMVESIAIYGIVIVLIIVS